MNEKILRLLACPACRGTLEPLAAPESSGPGGPQASPAPVVWPDLEGLACPACAVVYPVRDQIPVLLKEEAVRRPEWDAGKRAARPGR